MLCSVDFISLGNELKPELAAVFSVLKFYFISLGNELKPEPVRSSKAV